jgi:hypothetical protein
MKQKTPYGQMKQKTPHGQTYKETLQSRWAYTNLKKMDNSPKFLAHLS